MAYVRCSLCGMTFDDSHPLICHQKRRHEQWHDPPMTYRRNIIRGRVVWHAIRKK